MRKRTLILITASMLALSACKDGSESNDAASPAATSGAPDGLLGAAASKAVAATAAAALPQPDANKPLGDYPELDSGNQLMFLYVAASKLPPDYAKLAQSFSKEYRNSSDSFRKNDLLQAIKPQLDQNIAQATANPYGWMEVDDAGLGAYDFDRKGFPVGEFSDSTYRYFNDNYDYKIGWANHQQLAFLPVSDETLARQLESMRSGYNDRPRLKVYFFAQSADLDNERVKALVTRAVITNKSGRVLAEYGPDGSVATAAPATSSSNAPADAASIAADVMGG